MTDTRKPLKRVELTETGKLCNVCGEDKPLTEYWSHPSSKLGLKPQCKSCCRRGNRERRSRLSPSQLEEKRRKSVQFYLDNPGYRRNIHLRRRFGISLVQYESMLRDQDGRCAVCGDPDNRDHRFDSFHVDHCHDTGRVRGLLCAPCNKALGMMNDDPDRLLAAAAYLLQHTNLLTGVDQ